MNEVTELEEEEGTTIILFSITVLSFQEWNQDRCHRYLAPPLPLHSFKTGRVGKAPESRRHSASRIFCAWPVMKKQRRRRWLMGRTRVNACHVQGNGIRVPHQASPRVDLVSRCKSTLLPNYTHQMRSGFIAAPSSCTFSSCNNKEWKAKATRWY